MTAMDPRTQEILRQAFRRDRLSLLRYAGEAYPWATAAGGAALARLREIEAEDRAAGAALARYLFRRHVSPTVSNTFPMGFTTVNFISLEYLLPRLIEAHRGAVAGLERDAADVTDPEARAELEKLLAVKREHLAEMEELNVPKGEATKV